MTEVKIPEGYQTVMPYLILTNAVDFFKFTENVFDAKEKMKMLTHDSSLMHGEITIGDSTIMFGNASEAWGVQNAGLYVYVKNADDTFKKALQQGATIVQEMKDQDYGRSGGVTDPFGNVWWITSPK